MADPTPNCPPLWQVMRHASQHSRINWEHMDTFKYAAEIRAIADWLVPEEDEPSLGAVAKSQINKCIDEHSEWREWFVKDCIRAELLAEADRAEAGE
jgi:molybdopterin converting factor small subunit